MELCDFDSSPLSGPEPNSVDGGGIKSVMADNVVLEAAEGGECCNKRTIF